MGIISTEVEVGLNGSSIKHYESLGYKIPRRKNKWGKTTIPIGTKIMVKVDDLQKFSNAKILVECDNCKERYFIHNSDYQTYNHDGKIYCHTCAMGIFNSGENNNMYKINLTQEERELKRLSNEYSKFQNKVLKRDNYTCQCCKKVHTNLEVHHLDGYNWCIEKRTDVTNGITLCKNCHSNFHAIYGFGYNTKEQFEEWLGYTLKELTEYNSEIIPARKVYCYEEDKVYDNAKSFMKEHNLKDNANIYHACNNKHGCKTVCGMHLFWYNEYINLSQEEINKKVNEIKYSSKNKKVVCINTNTVFMSMKDASKREKINIGSISRCCLNKQKNAKNIHGDKSQWMFYDNYLKLNNLTDEEARLSLFFVA